jgi:DNA polymerase III delta prime subunit
LNLCKTRQEVFQGRLDIIKRIRHYVSHDSSQPMVVYGESGSGKTSLLAKAACMVHSWFPKKRPILLVRFLGESCAILRHLLHCTAPLDIVKPVNIYNTASICAG